MRAVPVGLGVMQPRIRVSPQRADYESAPPPRRGNAVRRSRRGLQKRRLKWLATALMLAAVPTAAVAWLMVSPRFAVRELAVVTGGRVPEVWVREALAPMVGVNLPRLPLAQAEQILRDHPWVQGADLRKDLPARLAVRVAERQAVALLRATGGLYYVDARGARIAAFDPVAQRAADLPLISVTEAIASGRELGNVTCLPNSGTEPAEAEDLLRLPPSGTLLRLPPSRGTEAAVLRCAVQLLSEIDDVEPSWATGLSEVEILSDEDFRIHTSALPFPVLVRIGTLHQRVRRLEELLPHIVEHFGAVAAVDLRFARRIIVKPSVEAASEKSRPEPQPNPARSAATTEYREAITDHAQRG